MDRALPSGGRGCWFESNQGHVLTQQEYDAKYRATGSSNISKATREWAEKLDQAAAMQAAGDDRYLVHIATALVNEEVLCGTPWNKCMNCGSPYRITPQWSNSTFCTDGCDGEYLDYVTGAEYNFE